MPWNQIRGSSGIVKIRPMRSSCRTPRPRPIQIPFRPDARQSAVPASGFNVRPTGLAGGDRWFCPAANPLRSF